MLCSWMASTTWTPDALLDQGSCFLPCQSILSSSDLAVSLLRYRKLAPLCFTKGTEYTKMDGLRDHQQRMMNCPHRCI